MSFGVLFNTVNGNRVIDGNYMVPEFIGKIYLTASGPTFSSIPTSGSGIEVPYNVSYAGGGIGTGYSCTNPGNRECIIFWTIPPSNGNEWFEFNSAQHIYAGLTHSEMQIYAESTSPGGAAPAVPEGYVFALGAVTQSSETYGMRVWNPSGGLVFDSGNKHISVNQVLTGLNYQIGTTNSVASGGLPAKPAFFIPQLNRQLKTRVSNNLHWQVWTAMVRRDGNTVYTRLLKYLDINIGDAGPNINQDYYSSNTSGLVMPVIDASLYD